MLTCTAIVTVQAGQEQAFERLMRRVAPKVREEPGNHAYSVYRSLQDPRVFMLYETYADQMAIDAHQAHLQAMDIDVCAWLDGAPVVTWYETLV